MREKSEGGTDTYRREHDAITLKYVNIGSTLNPRACLMKYMARVRYSEEQINALLEHAQEVGLGRAIRDLGYPGYGTAMRWAEMRGIVLDVDPVKQRASRTAQWYKDEEKLLVAQAGLERVYEQLQEGSLTPDDLKKLGDATKRYVEVMQLVNGEPTEIKQNNDGDDMFKKMLEEFNVSHRDLQPEEER